MLDVGFRSSIIQREDLSGLSALFGQEQSELMTLETEGDMIY